MKFYKFEWGFMVLVCACGLVCCEVYSDQFVVHIPGGKDIAKELAEDHGFTILGQVSFYFWLIFSSFSCVGG